MNVRLLFLLAALAGVFAYLGGAETPSFAGGVVSPGSRFVGAGSCAATACHNANFAHGPIAFSEYTFWVTRDPHAKAYEALFLDRSKQMQKNLHSSLPAHHDQRCLRCHAAPDYDEKHPPPNARYFKTDGVSCESCHGAAQDWLPLHHLDGWQITTPAEKKRLGMTDTQSLAGRAQLCARCHVGAPGMDVNHDLIAAGHPRLHFELAAYHAGLPHHWPDAKEREGRPDFATRLWAVGQLAAAHASLELLADRAADKSKPWPEFAELDCATCHHDLSTKVRGKRIDLPWVNLAALAPLALRIVNKQEERSLADSLGRIRDAMSKTKRNDVARDARSAALRLSPFLDADLPDEMPLTDLLQALLTWKTVGHDDAIQWQLALAAFGRSPKNLGLRDALLRQARKMDRPKHYDPQIIQKGITDLRNLGVR